MSSIIEASGSGGVDLSSLTSGELVLLGMLYAPMYLQGTQTYANQIPMSYLGRTETTNTIDVTNITSVTIDYFFRISVYANVSKVFEFKLTSSRGGDHFSFSPSMDNTTGSYSGTGIVLTLLDPSYGTDAYFYLKLGGGGSNNNSSRGYVQVTSFTTSDGKSHSADNLNY